MSVKAVVFDYGGVICRAPDPGVKETMAALARISAEKLRALDRENRVQHDLGIYDAVEYYRFLFEKAGVHPDGETVERIARLDHDSWKNLDGETEKLIADIQKLGLKTAILSNMPSDFLAWLRGNLPFYGGFDAAVFSCEEGLVKPRAEIYRVLAERIGCSYKEVVFFDDMRENIEGAVSLGIQGRVWENAESARRFLAGLEPVFSPLLKRAPSARPG